MASYTEIDPSTERLLEQSSSRRHERLLRREWLGEAAVSIAFAASALLLALSTEAARPYSAVVALAFVVAYAVVASCEFSSGAGYGLPTQIVFVPMLLLLPTPLVPLLVAAALMLKATVKVLRRQVAPERIVLTIADAWFSILPVLVLVVGGAQTPDWSRWPVYLVALGAQFAGDGLMSMLRASVCLGVRPGTLLGELWYAYRVDALLAPVGLLAAFAAQQRPLLALLVLPLVVMFALFSREREGRIAQTLELSRAYRGTAVLLGDVIEADDAYTGQHTQDVVELTVAVADELRVDEETRRAAELGALLHDVGKVAIPNEIINKEGPLDDEEWAIMKTHTVEGQRMLERVGGLLARVGVVVRASHERFDGGGYPDGLAGEEIPLAARIVSACDAYNAMTTDRSYRKALPVGVALAELGANAGTQFDPQVVEALFAVTTDLAPA